MHSRLASKSCKALQAGALFACIAAPAFADDDFNRFYVGAGVGQSKFKDTCTDANPSNGFVGSCKDTDTGFKVFGGALLSKYFGGEVAYIDFGKAKFDGRLFGTPISGRVKVDGLALDLLGRLPVGEHLSAFAKVGALGWHVDSSASLSGVGSASESATGSSLTYGVGAQFDFTRSLGVRAEWEHFDKVGNSDTGKSAIDFASVGLVYRF